MAATDPVSTTLSSAASSASVMGKVVDVELYDSSSFTGTWQVQRRIGSSWYVVSDSNTSSGLATGDGTALPYSVVVENAKARDVRCTVSAYTSGTLGVEIS